MAVQDWNHEHATWTPTCKDNMTTNHDDDDVDDDDDDDNGGDDDVHDDI